jgi:hypothetical protein
MGQIGGTSRRNTTRPIGSITKGLSLNKSLWMLAGEFANN